LPVALPLARDRQLHLRPHGPEQSLPRRVHRTRGRRGCRDDRGLLLRARVRRGAPVARRRAHEGRGRGLAGDDRGDAGAAPRLVRAGPSAEAERRRRDRRRARARLVRPRGGLEAQRRRGPRGLVLRHRHRPRRRRPVHGALCGAWQDPLRRLGDLARRARPHDRHVRERQRPLGGVRGSRVRDDPPAPLGACRHPGRQRARHGRAPRLRAPDGPALLVLPRGPARPLVSRGRHRRRLLRPLRREDGRDVSAGAASDVVEHARGRLAGRRVMITGGLGFLGSALAHRLVEYGAEVLLVDSLIPEYGGNLHNVADIRDRVIVNISDVRDQHAMKYLVRGQDFIFNLAGQTSHLDSMVDPHTDLEINCKSQLSILEACRRSNATARVVFASTRQIYGRPRYLPVDEAHPLEPVDVNGINKMAGEWYHILYHRVYGIPTVAIRMTNTYGPRMRVRDARQTFLGVWFRNLILGDEIQVFGDGAQLRDFNYVEDCVDAFLLAATDDRALGEVLNLGAAPPISLKDLAQLLVEINGSGTFRLVPFPRERKSIDIGDYYADHGKISRLTGWQPRTPLRVGIEASLRFFRAHGAAHYWNDLS